VYSASMVALEEWQIVMWVARSMEIHMVSMIEVVEHTQLNSEECT